MLLCCKSEVIDIDIILKYVVSREKLQALLLAESMMSILGEDWLVEQTEMHDDRVQIPVDK